MKRIIRMKTMIIMINNDLRNDTNDNDGTND